MSWYEKLNGYFPVEEMKSKQHMEVLLEEKTEYKKSESEKHVLMYVEEKNFIFVDYLLVTKHARGEGLGKKLLDELKKKQKPIILEVEPAMRNDQDSIKRLNFYKREDFVHASSIIYKRKSLATKKENKMEIIYWSPKNVSEEAILGAMKHIYKEVHTYKDTVLYGQRYQPVEEVLQMESGQAEDILQTI